MMLEKYDELRKCAKCGYHKSTVEFRPAGAWVQINGAQSFEYDVMLRQCNRCGYKWLELPLEEGKL